MLQQAIEGRGPEDGERHREVAPAPGKRTRAHQRSPQPPSRHTLEATLTEARALLRRALDAVPALTAAVDPAGARDPDQARAVAHEVSGMLTLADARVAAAGDAGGGDPALQEQLAQIEAELASAHAACDPLLARRPPSYASGADRDAATLGGDDDARARVDAAERREVGAWNAMLDSPQQPVQLRSRGDVAPATDVPQIAQTGVNGAGARLPHLDAIQSSFGRHDVSAVSAHVGGAAAQAADAIGAEAYATGSHVAFASEPSLFVAAHEAAHVVQQRAGVSLLGGVGEAGDVHEQHADAVAERVVLGQAAGDLLDATYTTGGQPAVQRKEKLGDDAIGMTLGLLLRDVKHRAFRGAKGRPTRTLKKARLRHAINVMAGLEEIVQTAALGTAVAWTGLDEDVAEVKRVLADLQADLEASDATGLAKEFTDSVDAFRRTVPDTLIEPENVRVVAREAQPVDAGDRIKLLRLVLAAARERLRGFKSSGGGKTPEGDQAKLHLLCLDVAKDLSYAADGIGDLDDVDDRQALGPEVDKTSMLVEDIVDGRIRAGNYRWHRSLATLFDAEAILRERAGEPPVSRTFSGQTNPEDARDQLLAIADGDPTVSACDTPFVDTSSAVQGIGISLANVFERQALGVDNVQTMLNEPDPPKDPSLFETILKIAVNVALSMAAGAIGSAVGDRARKVLEARASRSAVEGIPASARDEILKSSLKDSALQRTVLADAIKDGAKELFKSSYKAVEGEVTKRKVGKQPKTWFFNEQKVAIQKAKTEGLLQLAHLRSALVQLELDELNALNHELCSEMPDIAQEEQEAATVREWINFQARWSAGAMQGTSRDAATGHDGRGFLVLDVKIDRYEPGSMKSSVRRITLVGAEGGVKQFIKDAGGTVAEAPINKRFHFTLAGRTLTVQQTPDAGLHFDELDDEDLAILKAYANGEVIDGVVLDRIERDPEAYAHISDGAAQLTAAQLVVAVSSETALANVELDG